MIKNILTLLDKLYYSLNIKFLIAVINSVMWKIGTDNFLRDQLEGPYYKARLRLLIF